MNTPTPQTIDDYISTFGPEVQSLLEQVRKTIRLAAPEAAEKISYAIPTFYLKGNLVHFAAFKNHIGFYALPSTNQQFEKELAAYKTGRGSVQFPFDKPIPFELIDRIVRLRVSENLTK